jgi:hypothetical protein
VDLPRVNLPRVDHPGGAELTDHAVPHRDADEASSEQGIDIGWGDTRGVAPEDYDGGILSGGLTDGLNATVIQPEPAPEPEGETEAEPVMVPGATPVLAGHMFTGQLSLISLLLGLGIAVLRVRRR